jgi:hypothetical protein
MSWNMETPKNGLNPSQDDAVAPSRPVYTAYAEYLGDLLQEDPKYFRCISLRDRLLSDKNKALPRGSLELFRFAVDGTLLYSSKHSLQKPLEDFKHTLIDSEESAAYQIVTLEISARNLPPVVIDILGLELDIGPRFWLHVENDYETRPTRWVCRDDFIQAGKNILAILDTSPKVPTKTGICSTFSPY